GKAIGEMGLPYPTIAAKLDKKAAIVYAEIDVEAFAQIESGSIVYDEPSKYPEIEVDLTFLSPVFAPIGDAIRAAQSALVKAVRVADIYDDEQGRALTVRITFADKTKTLTREEVTAVTDAVIADLEQKGISLKQ
ncbi:MAG: phenylalanine--tRNA ligase subunit beta, partial [Oscillospiraceae bacterium]|nr:phenylalanine--tRNA ligase subunit beta [Oscillospiraceae bacterium]